MDDGLGSDVSPDNFEGNRVAMEVAFRRAAGNVKLGSTGAGTPHLIECLNTRNNAKVTLYLH